MDYQVSFFQKSWEPRYKASTNDVIEDVINTRDAAMRQLRLPVNQEDNVDYVSCGVWLKVRTDRPHQSESTTAFVSVKDKGLHRPTPFSYIREPLSETQIRLVELAPGEPGTPLSGRLRVVSLTEGPPYSALSYTWGAGEIHDTILLTGSSAERHRITKNLHAALCKIRQAGIPTLLWVDALCIDQTSASERSHQVQIMGTIFANAQEVVVWLGEASEHSKFGLETLQYIADGKAFEPYPPWDSQPPEVVQRGLSDILNRPWFHRIWTVQEAALSSGITLLLCDDGSTCRWQADLEVVYLFIRGLKFAAVTANWSENGFARAEDLGLPGVDLTGMINLLGQQMQQIMRRGLSFGATDPEPDLLDIAYEVKDKYCTDPRDRLYAILGLGLVRGSSDLQVRADYTKTLHEVQDDFRLFLLKANRTNGPYRVFTSASESDAF